jgi:hypothetical protein
MLVMWVLQCPMSFRATPLIATATASNTINWRQYTQEDNNWGLHGLEHESQSSILAQNVNFTGSIVTLAFDSLYQKEVVHLSKPPTASTACCVANLELSMH